MNQILIERLMEHSLVQNIINGQGVILLILVWMFLAHRYKRRSKVYFDLPFGFAVLCMYYIGHHIGDYRYEDSCFVALIFHNGRALLQQRRGRPYPYVERMAVFVRFGLEECVALSHFQTL